MSETLAQLKILQRADGVPVTIRRSTQTCDLIAVPSFSKTQLFDGGGSLTEVMVDDWIIVASEWTLDGPPQKGDEIAVDDSAKYLVSHPDNKTPVYSNFNLLDRPAKAWIVHSTPR